MVTVKYKVGIVYVVQFFLFFLFLKQQSENKAFYEGWNFNSGNYLFTTDTK